MAIFSSDIVTSAISASIADTAVDIFVYDTSKDSDGGAWRKRTTHTSWYNETLGTATRGTRKEFPAVAVIVMQEGTLTIYDGDDPDLPMWMVFTDNNDTGSQFASAKMLGCRTATSIFMLNGMLMCVGKGPYHDGATELNFLSDSAKKHMNNGYYYNTLNISQRETTGGYFTVTSGTPSIVSNLINDVAMTVLPNALIDPSTGLPIPTIAVATASGVSVIKDDGSVYDITSSTTNSDFVYFVRPNLLTYCQDSNTGNKWTSFVPIPSNDKTNSYTYTNANNTWYANYWNTPTSDIIIATPTISPENINYTAVNPIGSDMMSFGSGKGLGMGTLEDTSPRMIAYVNTSYNTGYMHGDIKGAFLSDTDDTDKTNGQTDPDRSANNNALTVNGTITKSAVATGADLVAYSGFSASNYLQQPYNSDLAPGTAAYSVSCWFKTGTSSGDQYIFDRNGGGAGSRNLLLIMNTSAGNPNKFQFWHRDNSGNITEIQITDKTITDNVWHQVVALNDGTNYRVYVDGEVSSITNTGNPIRNVISDNNPPMFVGIRHSGGSTFMTGSMALFRYSLSAPSPEQIKKMYEDEKVLFQSNANATLYGSSDAVTALAYDDTTELLHVGTSSGRSEFQGLRRINNTTDAVTAAISASNNLVAEK